jgi:hypothetical protein
VLISLWLFLFSEKPKELFLDGLKEFPIFRKNKIIVLGWFKGVKTKNT